MPDAPQLEDFPEASLAVQALGVATVGIFVLAASAAFWIAFDLAMGARPGDVRDHDGGDIAEFGLRAHNFG